MVKIPVLRIQIRIRIILGSQIYIRVKSRVRIRTKMKSQIGIKVMLLRNSVVKCRLKLLFY